MHRSGSAAQQTGEQTRRKHASTCKFWSRLCRMQFFWMEIALNILCNCVCWVDWKPLMSFSKKMGGSGDTILHWLFWQIAWETLRRMFFRLGVPSLEKLMRWRMSKNWSLAVFRLGGVRSTMSKNVCCHLDLGSTTSGQLVWTKYFFKNWTWDKRNGCLWSRMLDFQMMLPKHFVAKIPKKRCLLHWKATKARHRQRQRCGNIRSSLMPTETETTANKKTVKVTSPKNEQRQQTMWGAWMHWRLSN